MAHESTVTQERESRTALVGVRVTASEKGDIQLIAALNRVSESELMRPRVEQIVARAKEVRESNTPAA